MANRLGAFRESDWEYAEAVFDFVKREIKLSFSYFKGAVKTLKSGRGTCIDKVSLFIALCRAGGLPARYQLYSTALAEPIYNFMAKTDSAATRLYNAIGYAPGHGSAEVQIDGKWIMSDVTFAPEYEAASGVPLSHLGENTEGKWGWCQSKKRIVLEGLPLGISLLSRIILNGIGRGAAERANVGLARKRAEGRQILDKSGEAEYDKQIRKTYRIKMPEITQKLLGHREVHLKA